MENLMPLRLTLFILFAAACEETPPPADAGTDASFDAGRPAFDLRLESALDVPLRMGDELGVDYGCDGDAHVSFDVIAEGEGLDGATVSAAMYGRTWELAMSTTATGAELRGFVFVLEDQIAPRGITLPRGESLRVRVVRTDGAVVVLETGVVLVEADVCKPECTYTDVPGSAFVRDVLPATTPPCIPGQANLLIDFTPDGSEETQTEIPVTYRIPPNCMEPVGLAPGMTVPARRRDLLPKSGECTPPFIWEILPDEAPCDAICP
jgi:hypothetical protein